MTTIGVCEDDRQLRSSLTRAFRANIVRNLDEFHEVFGTTEADGLWLHPEQRVRIW